MRDAAIHYKPAGPLYGAGGLFAFLYTPPGPPGRRIVSGEFLRVHTRRAGPAGLLHHPAIGLFSPTEFWDNKSMPLSDVNSQTTRADVIRAYRDNLDYDLEQSLDKAKQFIKAGRWLLQTPLTKVSGGDGGEEVELNPEIVQAALNQAEQWYHASYARLSGGANRRYADMTNFKEH